MFLGSCCSEVKNGTMRISEDWLAVLGSEKTVYAVPRMRDDRRLTIVPGGEMDSMLEKLRASVGSEPDADALRMLKVVGETAEKLVVGDDGSVAISGRILDLVGIRSRVKMVGAIRTIEVYPAEDPEEASTLSGFPTGVA